MPNNTGLKFNPLTGLNDNSQQSVPTTVHDYMNVQIKPIDIQWDPEQKKKVSDFVNWAAYTPIEEQEELSDPFYDLNKWNEGLNGLDKEDRDLWEQQNAFKTKGKSDEWKERLWKNQQYYSVFGEDDFRSHTAEERDKRYSDYLLGAGIQKKFGDNDNINQLMSLTPEGKEELLKSGYKSDVQLGIEREQIKDKDWSDFSLEDRYYAATSEGYRQGLTGAGLGSVAGAALGTPFFGVGAGVGSLVGAAIGGISGTISGLLSGIAHPEDSESYNNARKKIENDDILNKITVADNERKKEDTKPEIEERWLQYLEAYNRGELKDKDVDDLFDDIALSGKKEYRDTFGNIQQYDYQGSSYYSAFKDSDEFEHFSTADKLKYLAQTEALSKKYGQNVALSALEQDMQNYVSDNQDGFDWAGNTLKNVWVGGLANLGMKHVALGALASRLAYGEKGLAEYLQGRDASGSGEKNWNINNPQYWNKVDQYNDLGIDLSWLNSDWGNHIAEADANGKLSTSTNVVRAGTENDWSWNTLNEALRMSKYAWSDYGTNVGLAKLVRGATALAGGKFLEPGVLATESSGLSKAINTTGSFGVLNASSLGIDAAYGINTFQEVLDANNQEVDKLVEKDTEAEVQRRLSTPEALKEFKSFVDAENEKRKKMTAGKENAAWFPVDEEAAWKDYTEYIRRQVAEEQEALHASDREQAEKDAANAYAIDASIEHLRMATTNGIFKNYLFDKGTLNALRLNNPYVNTTFRDGAYALGKNATSKRALSTIAENVWGGFHSNYFDDVTVGFAKSFGIQDYNNYLLRKYNPAAYGAVMDDYVNPFLAGLVGIGDSMKEKRSFLDGAIGAIGTGLTFSPNIAGMASHKEIMKQAAEIAEADKKAGRKPESISAWETASHFANNPVIEAFANAERDTKMTQREIDRVNKLLKENTYALNNIVETATALNRASVTRKGTSVLDAEDAKDEEAFALASSLLALKNSAVVANAQAEPDKTNWSKKKKAANYISNIFNSALGIQMFETSDSPYYRAMQALQDASTIGETDDAATVSRQQELIDTFLGLDTNKSITENMTDEQKTDFAKERLKKNAGNLLDMVDRVEKLQQKFEKSIGATYHPDISQQLIYQYALDNRWKQRSSELEQWITGEEDPTLITDKDHSGVIAIAKYGSVEGFNKAKKAQEKRVATAEKNVRDAELQVKKENDPTKSIKTNTIDKYKRKIDLKNAEQNLKKEKAALNKLNAEEEDIKSTLENKSNVIPAETILHLNVDDRLRMLDDYYREDYSEEQQKEIDKAKNLLIEDGTTVEEAMQKVRDAAILNHRIEDNMEVAKRIMQNPMEAKMMQLALERNRRNKIMDYFNDKIVAEAYYELSHNPEAVLSEDNVANAVRKHSSTVLDGMLNAAQEEMRSERKSDNDKSDDTLDNIINGIAKVFEERSGRLKDIIGLDSFVKKTNKVSHTDTELQEGAPEKLVTSEVELSNNDKKLMNIAMDYAVERGLSLEELPEQVGTDGFDRYLQERNHSTLIENQVNPIDHDAMKTLVEDVLKAYNENKEAVDKAKEEKATDKPQSVATAPVVPKSAKPSEEGRNEEARPGEKANDDPFGVKAKKDKPEETAEEKPTFTGRNSEIIDAASMLNKDILSDIGALLQKVDTMQMEEKTRDALKNIIQALVSSRHFDNIKALQGKILEESIITNQVDAPQISARAKDIAGMEISGKVNTSENTNAESSKEGSTNSSQLFGTPLNTIISRDLDKLIAYPLWKDFIERHNMIPFLHKLEDAMRKERESWHDSSKQGPIHQGQFVFIYDPALASNVQEGMESNNQPYNPSVSAPVIIALEITDANRHLVEDESALYSIEDKAADKVDDGTGKKVFVTRKYQPVGILPASQELDSDSPEMKANAMRMAAIRNRINYSDDNPHALRLAPKNDTGKYNGTILKVPVDGTIIESHAEDGRRPQGLDSTPITGVQTLMEDNAMSPAETFVKSTEEEREAYREAKSKGIKFLRSNPLYRRMREAFIDRLVKNKREATNQDDVDPKEMDFKIQKGTHDTYPKIVLTKKISETVDKNNPSRLITDILKEVNDSGDNAQELINSNSRFKRLYDTLKKLHMASGLFNSDGNIVVTRGNYDTAISTFESAFKSALESNFKLSPSPTVQVEIGDGKPSDKNIIIKVYSGDINIADNLLATMETKYNGTISEAEFANFMKNLILDKDNNVRINPDFTKYERVKWQVNYEDATTANNSESPEYDVARNNLRDLFDDGVLEMQMTKLSYPANSLSMPISGGLKSLYAESATSPDVSPAPAVTETKAAHEVETNTGKVDSDSGLRTEAARDEILSKPEVVPVVEALKELIRRSADRIVEGKHYNILGQIWSRVTSIKSAMPGMGSRFNENSGYALPSSALGNSFDSFGRDVFNGIFNKLNSSERLTEFEGYDNSTAKKYEEAYTGLKAFEARILGEKGQAIIRTGTKENPGKITVKGILDVLVKRNGKIETKKVRVAGTIDALAIDGDGNLHIYDFKTHSQRGTMNKTTAIKDGYDRQQSTYAKFLEDEVNEILRELGYTKQIQVKTINILPATAYYPVPSGENMEGTGQIQNPEKTYRRIRPGSDQLEYKEVGADDSAYETFDKADFKVEKEFTLDRLSDEQLTASFDKMTEDEKAAIVEAIQDQSQNPNNEITKTDEVISGRPEESESFTNDEAEEGGRPGGGRFSIAESSETSENNTESTDSTTEKVLQAVAPENSLRDQLNKLKMHCGGKLRK